MLNNLYKKIKDNYFKHGQWLQLDSHYAPDENQTEQMVCLIDKESNKCILCVVIQTFNNLESGWEHTPYCIYNPLHREFTITIPKFSYLTQEEINKAIKFIIRKNFWLIFNIKIDGQTI